jgi:hypothetical protein
MGLAKLVPIPTNPIAKQKADTMTVFFMIISKMTMGRVYLTLPIYYITFLITCILYLSIIHRRLIPVVMHEAHPPRDKSQVDNQEMLPR